MNVLLYALCKTFFKSLWHDTANISSFFLNAQNCTELFHLLPLKFVLKRWTV